MLNMSQFQASIHAHERAQAVFPQGVNSPLRLFSEVDTPALVMASAKGAHITDVDGNTYVDFITGLGAHILGHGHPRIMDAIQGQLEKGTLFSCCHELEYQLGKKIVDSSACVESVRFVCSGTEAVMGAIRTARAYTGREKIVRFTGSYHGHSDEVFYRGEHKVSDWRDKGLVRDMAAFMLTLPFEDIEAIHALLRSDRNIAAVIVEPVASNMGLKVPSLDFLKALRTACDQADALLIFDEVVSGFRFCPGSVANLFDVQPDLVTFGKIIGGGLPAGCFGGRKKVMALIDGLSGYFHGGTFAANPLSCAAGLAVIEQLNQPGFYENLDRKGALFLGTLTKGCESELEFSSERLGSLFSIWPRIKGGKPETQQEWAKRFRRVHQDVVMAGFLLPPSVDEPFFISSAHSDQDVIGCAKALQQAILRSMQ